MSIENHHPSLHRLAVVTACVALLPVTLGALTTSQGAGMAFPDWPTSDGYSMLFYPWFQSIAESDKFLEHGHRLAGALIGLFSIALAVATWKWDRRLSVTVMSCVVLLSVVAQGILGGLRVLENDARFAMYHGLFASLVFTMMVGIALVTSKSWLSAHEQADLSRNPHDLKPWAVVLNLTILGQYALGGMLRHLGRTLDEHILGAVLVLIITLAAAIAALRHRHAWLRRCAQLLLLLVVVQIALGLASFVLKFGWAASGWVAVRGTVLQSLTRSAHTVVGMLLFSTSVVLTMCVYRLGTVWSRVHPDSLAGFPRSPLLSKLEGGAS
jgi:heme a synthase